MFQYELTLVLKPDSKLKPIKEKLKGWIEKLKGKIIKEEEWGKKKMVYPIKNYKDGLYFYTELKLSPQEVGKLIRSIQLEEAIIRYLIIRK
jgi:small subunit ribosomal protein S6